MNKKSFTFKEKFLRFTSIILRLVFVFVSVVIYPIGLFLLGYLVGKRYNSQKTFMVSDTNASIIDEKNPMVENTEVLKI